MWSLLKLIVHYMLNKNAAFTENLMTLYTNNNQGGSSVISHVCVCVQDNLGRFGWKFPVGELLEQGRYEWLFGSALDHINDEVSRLIQMGTGPTSFLPLLFLFLSHLSIPSVSCCLFLSPVFFPHLILLFPSTYLPCPYHILCSVFPPFPALPVGGGLLCLAGGMHYTECCMAKCSSFTVLIVNNLEPTFNDY